MTKNERNIVLPVIFSSSILFIIGLLFSYFFLVPAALTFFINYGADIVEPFWSFEQYFDFVAVLIFTTGIAFQVPVIQVVSGVLGLVSGKTMLQAWKYVVVFATIISAIITPSTDPVTQLLLSVALIMLYLSGCTAVIFLKKEI
jgi:sec-independent protein translocase protein TatC